MLETPGKAAVDLLAWREGPGLLAVELDLAPGPIFSRRKSPLFGVREGRGADSRGFAHWGLG